MATASVLILVNEKMEYLLLQRKYEPFGYGLVGGGIDPGETSLQAVIRECKEEIGFDISGNDIIYLGEVESLFGTSVAIFLYNDYFTDQVVLSDEHKKYIFSRNFNKVKFAGNTGNWVESFDNTVIDYLAFKDLGI